jgi:predicted transcriptional regulator
VNVLAIRKSGESQKLVRVIVVLIRNTTWRCGKLERVIVAHLYRKCIDLGKHGMSVKDLIQSFKLTGKKRNEFLDAIRRLERRNIVRIVVL